MPVPKGRLKVAQDEPGFPVGVGGKDEPHAAFRKESRTRRYVQSRVQEIRGSPGYTFLTRQVPQGRLKITQDVGPISVRIFRVFSGQERVKKLTWRSFRDFSFGN
jgi:hypothetical protein